METSIFIAKILGLAYVVMGLGFLLNPKYFKSVMNSIMKDKSAVLWGGMMALVVGFLIVNAHNIWVKDWTVLVTIVGWIGLVKGVLLFVAPKFLLDFSEKVFKKIPMQGIGLGALVLGCVFGYFGFFA